MKHRAHQLITVLAKYNLNVTSLCRYTENGEDVYSPQFPRDIDTVLQQWRYRMSNSISSIDKI